MLTIFLRELKGTEVAGSTRISRQSNPIRRRGFHMVAGSCHSFLAAIALLSALLASTAHAVPVEVNSRAALGGNDFIDWGTVGPETGVVSPPIAVSSNGGLNAIVSHPFADPFQLFVQGGPFVEGTKWPGNFASGDKLLYTFTGIVTIAFSVPVSGAGAQLQTGDVLGLAFSVTLETFDSSNNLLASFGQDGLSSSAADNSAVFLGVLNDAANIDHVTYTLVSGIGGLALNQLDLVTTVQAPLEPVPEPGTILLLATSLAGLGAAQWRKSRKLPQ